MYWTDTFPSAWSWESSRLTVDQKTVRLAPGRLPALHCVLGKVNTRADFYYHPFQPLHPRIHKNKILLLQKTWKLYCAKELYRGHLIAESTAQREQLAQALCRWLYELLTVTLAFNAGPVNKAAKAMQKHRDSLRKSCITLALTGTKEHWHLLMGFLVGEENLPY